MHLVFPGQVGLEKHFQETVNLGKLFKNLAVLVDGSTVLLAYTWTAGQLSVTYLKAEGDVVSPIW